MLKEKKLLALSKDGTNAVTHYSVLKTSLSCPLLRLLLGDIGFVYRVMFMVVIGSSLPILRQRRWSLLYDVY
jgi:hypothetical protein